MMIDHNHFFTIAKAARARGFPITPLRDKRPFLPAWNKHPLTTETEIITAAKEYPECDVGLVLKRQLGEPFAIDIDNPGVIERMERETGKSLPDTYTVLSRPVTAPYKRHVFFRHTKYSDSVFDKNVNSGEYDLIGTGIHALQVVSEGCVRPDTGEVREGNGLPIADCPDWVADWLVSDSKRLRNEKAAEARRRMAEAREILKEVAEEDAAERRRRTGYDKHGKTERYRYLLSKAKTLCNAGVAKDRLPAELLAQFSEDYGPVKDDDPNGWPLEELKQKIQSIVNSPGLKRGNPPPVRPLKSPGLNIKRAPETEWERRLKLARGFDQTMTSEEVYDRLGLDIKNANHKRAVSRVMKAAGFVAERGRRTALWRRMDSDSVPPARREGLLPLSPTPTL